MNDYPLLYAVSYRLLQSFKSQKTGAFSAWLHFDREWKSEDDAVIASLIVSGCRSILITGSEAEAIHDRIDSIAYNSTNELVLTLSNEVAGREAAFDFISTRCPQSVPSFFLLSTFSTDARLETIALGENLKLVGLEMAHFELDSERGSDT